MGGSLKRDNANLTGSCDGNKRFEERYEKMKQKICIATLTV